MTEKLDTFRDVVKALGGVPAVAAALNVSPFAAKKMRDRRSISPEYWPTLLDACRTKGIGIEMHDLVAMRGKRKPEPPRKKKVS